MESAPPPPPPPPLKPAKVGPNSCMLCVFATVILLSALAATWPLIKPYMQAPVDLPLPLNELITWACVGFFGGAMLMLVGFVFFVRCETMIWIMNEMLGQCCRCAPCEMPPPPQTRRPPTQKPPSAIESGILLVGGDSRGGDGS